MLGDVKSKTDSPSRTACTYTCISPVLIEKLKGSPFNRLQEKKEKRIVQRRDYLSRGKLGFKASMIKTTSCLNTL